MGVFEPLLSSDRTVLLNANPQGELVSVKSKIRTERGNGCAAAGCANAATIANTRAHNQHTRTAFPPHCTDIVDYSRSPGSFDQCWSSDQYRGAAHIFCDIERPQPNPIGSKRDRRGRRGCPALLRRRRCIVHLRTGGCGPAPKGNVARPSGPLPSRPETDRPMPKQDIHYRDHVPFRGAAAPFRQHRGAIFRRARIGESCIAAAATHIVRCGYEQGAWCLQSRGLAISYPRGVWVWRYQDIL